MKSKTLRASTIIPRELYVHRDADRQVRRVLEEMGRPAYVLVARQMGKTNLLLNARRELQTANDAFAYIDLTNRFSSPRECFRNIVDTTLQSHEGRLGTAGSHVARIRGRLLPPHKEHELELRELLRAIPGKLVIILDEVDSLTTGAFADQIFAQVRSTYFSRANIAEYERLTYILSGVAEPGELITNAKLSPFNIGEKIYLDDFTQAEFSQFLKSARLTVSEDVAGHVFGWTNGNPRMTWDVCSELEDLVIERGGVEVTDVDSVVARLYLTSFDRAPIDHIRALVETSAELRAALVSLGRAEGASIPDSVRSKLYLAGIVASRGESPRIKNRIIGQALSEQWVREVEVRKSGILKVATEELASRRFAAAIPLYEEFLGEGRASETEKQTAYDGLSEAYYELGEYKASLEWLQQGKFDKAGFAQPYYRQVLREGLCLFSLGNYEASIEKFKEVVGWGEDLLRSQTAAVNLASAYFRWKADEFKEEIFRLYKEALEKVSQLDRGAREEVEATARYNLSSAYQHFGDAGAGIREMRAALDVASGSERPVLLYELARLEVDVDRKRQLLAESVATIVGEHAKISRVPEIRLRLTGARIGELLVDSFVIDREGAFEKLLGYCCDATGDVGSALADVPFETVLAGMLSRDRDLGLDVAVRLVERAGEEMGFRWARGVVYEGGRGTSKPRTKAKGTEEYLRLLRGQPRTRELDRLDLSILGQELGRTFNDGRLRETREILGIAELFREATRPGHLVFLDYVAMLAAERFGDARAERIAATRVLEGSSNASEVALLSAADVESVRRAASAAVATVPPPTRRRTSEEKKYGRNEWVTVRHEDGRIERAKYKKVEAELQAGRCSIV